MITGSQFTDMVLSLQGAEETPHFDRLGYRIKGKRMFCSYLAANNTANVFLTIDEQRLFCNADFDNIFPLPNKWGDKGVTTFVLDKVSAEILMEALRSAYADVLKPKKAVVK